MTAPLDDASNNPLLAPSTLPYGAPPLDQLKPEYFLPALKTAVASAEKEIAAIKNNPAAPGFANTIEALEFSGGALNRIECLFGCIKGTKSCDAIVDIEDEMNLLSTRSENNKMLDEALFARIKVVYDARDTLKLTPEQQRLLQKTYEDFVNKGALLDDDAKQELRDISEKLAALGTVYKNNSLKSSDAFQKSIDDESDLAGVPERAKNDYQAAAEAVRTAGVEAREEADKAKAAAALPDATEETRKRAADADKKAVEAERRAAGAAGKWLIKLSPPPTDILSYSANRALREEIYRASNSVACQPPFDNHPVVLDIVRLRQRKAEVMSTPARNYSNYASYVLADRMAKTPEAVMELLETNLSVYKPAAEKFLQQVKDYAKKTDGITDFQPWDFSLYSRRLKEETFKVDVEELRPYFELEKVLEGLRTHAEKLFNIKLTETKKGKYPVYDPEMKVYEVTDNKTGEMIGLYYTDYYARPGQKSSGAWMDSFRERGLEDGENKFAIAYNVCNFAKPTKEQPTLLSLDEVTTTFHEFGHALHALLGEGDYPSLTGTNVKWDFVEMLSQMQENWVKEKEVLDTFAAHYKTGEKLPAALIKKINDMENFDAAYAGLRQTFFGLLDMKWHTTDPKTIKSAEELEDSVAAQASMFPRVAAPMSVSFGHLFGGGGGYASGYYGYKWSERLAADIFREFKKNGLYDRKTADRLRGKVYSKGGTVEESTQVTDMLGREADPNALYEQEGLLPPETKKTPGPAPTRPPKL